MPYSVRLCRDLTGWFATMGGDAPPCYPGVRFHWEADVTTAGDAIRVLDLAQALAKRLRGEARPWDVDLFAHRRWSGPVPQQGVDLAPRLPRPYHGVPGTR